MVIRHEALQKSILSVEKFDKLEEKDVQGFVFTGLVSNLSVPLDGACVALSVCSTNVINNFVKREVKVGKNNYSNRVTLQNATIFIYTTLKKNHQITLSIIYDYLNLHHRLI